MFYRPDGQSASYGNGEAKPGEIEKLFAMLGLIKWPFDVE